MTVSNSYPPSRLREGLGEGVLGDGNRPSPNPSREREGRLGAMACGIG